MFVPALIYTRNAKKNVTLIVITNEQTFYWRLLLWTTDINDIIVYVYIHYVQYPLFRQSLFSDFYSKYIYLQKCCHSGIVIIESHISNSKCDIIYNSQRKNTTIYGITPVQGYTFYLPFYLYIIFESLIECVWVNMNIERDDTNKKTIL